jgi:FkbM family methyltransferase
MIAADWNSGLVMDIGVSEGNDTAFYLAKGFRVIGVEADPATCAHLRRRFAAEIRSGALKLLPFAASGTFGDLVDFFVHTEHQGISALTMHDLPYLKDGYRREAVLTIDWKTLVAQQGVPRYAKIDIEGNEESFLRGMAGHDRLPEFISVECHFFEPVAVLYALGYRRYRLVDQNPAGGFVLPAKQMEGASLERHEFLHASGPFGLDVFGDGRWLDINQMRDAWICVQPQRDTTWFDCHAWMPN